MNLIFVKHENSCRPFLFTSDTNFEVGDEVVCQTLKGEKRGRIVCTLWPISDEAAQQIANACGAYWPLAKVLRKYDKPVVTSIDEVPQWLIDKIRKNERAAILALINPQELPFDL